MRLLQVACKRAGEVTQGSAQVALLRGKGVLAGTRSPTTSLPPSLPPSRLHNTLRKLQVVERVYAVMQHPGLGIHARIRLASVVSPSTLDPRTAAGSGLPSRSMPGSDTYRAEIGLRLCDRGQGYVIASAVDHHT